MNKTIKILAAMLPLFITSCTNDDTTVTTATQQEQPVTISAGITRGEGQSEPFAYDKIKVTNVTRKDKGLLNNSAVFTLVPSESSPSWTSNGTLLWSAGEENTFQAVYPATAEYSSFTVPTDQSTEANFKAADWMTGETKATLNLNEDASNKTIDINLTRQMAMVVVQITGVDVSTLNSMEVESPSPNNSNITFETSGNRIKAYRASTTDNKFSAIIPPGSKGKDVILCYLTLSDSDEKSLKLQSDINFEAGKKYTFQCSLTSQPDSAPTRSASPDNLTLVSVEPI